MKSLAILPYLCSAHEVLKEKKKFIKPIIKVDCATWTEEGEVQIGAVDQVMNTDEVSDTLVPMETQENVLVDVSAEVDHLLFMLLKGNLERRVHTSLHGEEYKEALELNSAEMQLQGPVTCKSTSHSRDTALVMPKEKQNALQILPNATLGQQIITDKSSTESDESPADISTDEARSTNIRVLKTANTSPLVPKSILSSEMPGSESLHCITDEIQTTEELSSAVNMVRKSLETEGTVTPEEVERLLALRELVSSIVELLSLYRNTASSVANQSVTAKEQNVEPASLTKIKMLLNMLNTLPLNTYKSAKAKEATLLTVPETTRETLMSQMEISGSADQNLAHELLTRGNNEIQPVAEENTGVNKGIDIAVDTNTVLHTMEVENPVPLKQAKTYFIEQNRQGGAKESEAQEKNSSGNLVIKKCIVSKTKERLTFSDKSTQTSNISSSVIGLQNSGLGTLVPVEHQKRQFNKLRDAAGIEVDKGVHTQSSKLPNIAPQIETAEMQGGLSSQAGGSEIQVSTDSSSVPNTGQQIETSSNISSSVIGLQNTGLETLVPVEHQKRQFNKLGDAAGTEVDKGVHTQSSRLPNIAPQIETAEMQTLEGDQRLVSLPSLSSPSFLLEQETQIPETSNLEYSVGREVGVISLVSARALVTERCISSDEDDVVSQELPFPASSPIIAMQKIMKQIREAKRSSLLKQQEAQICETSKLENAIEMENIPHEPAGIPATVKCIFSKTEESKVLPSLEPPLSALSSKVGIQNIELETMEAEEPVPLKQIKTQILERSKFKNVSETEVEQNISFETAETHIQASKKFVTSETQTLVPLEPPCIGSRIPSVKQLDERKRGRRCQINKIPMKKQKLDLAVAYDQMSVRKGCISDETKSRKRKITRT